MKRIAVVILLCLLFLSGCSSNIHKVDYSNDDAYAVGYEEGYNDAFEEPLDNPDYTDEIHSFQTAIADLMYDHEYDTVKNCWIIIVEGWRLLLKTNLDQKI